MNEIEQVKKIIYNKNLSVKLIKDISIYLRWSKKRRKVVINLLSTPGVDNTGIDLIVWPETSLPGDYLNSKNIRRFVDKIQKQTGSDILYAIKAQN